MLAQQSKRSRMQKEWCGGVINLQHCYLGVTHPNKCDAGLSLAAAAGLHDMYTSVLYALV